MKYLYLFGLFFISTCAFAQNETVAVVSELSDCGETIGLYTFNGFTFDEVQREAIEAETPVRFAVPAQQQQFYYLGPDPSNVMPLIVGEEPEIVVQGSCKSLRSSTVKDSPLNQEYTVLKTEINRLKVEGNRLLTSAARAQEEEERNELMEKLAAVDQQKLQLLDSMKQENPFFADIVAVDTYLSFFHHQGDYANEVEYFAGEFFKHADLSSNSYNYLPWTYQSFQTYTKTLLSVRGLPNEALEGYLGKAMEELKPGSKAQQLAMAGILSALQEKKHPLFADFAKQYTAQFAERSPQTAQIVAQKLKQINRLMPGSVAPDFEQETPEGEMLALSSLRGKYVLIDFWASWCGPCRRENPNVVRMYDQYKDKGFDILGVSLDRTRDRWLAAIEKDGLTWPQVSDLKGWQNEVAQMYEIRSIPRTILLDPEGRIIARDLRGPTLEAKLEELFK